MTDALVEAVAEAIYEAPGKRVKYYASLSERSKAPYRKEARAAIRVINEHEERIAATILDGRKEIE